MENNIGKYACINFDTDKANFFNKLEEAYAYGQAIYGDDPDNGIDWSVARVEEDGSYSDHYFDNL